MRDIRSDLEERVQAINEQIHSAYGWFEKMVQQLEKQRDEQVVQLKEVQATLNRLIEFENASILVRVFQMNSCSSLLWGE